MLESGRRVCEAGSEVICPNCGHAIATESAAKTLGSLGGSVKGKSKSRDVDYSAMARLSHQKRRENKAKQG